MDLACRQDFNLLEAFAMFDIDGKGYCTVHEFHNKFRAIAPEKNPCIQDFELMFKRHNKTDDGKLKYSEFMHALSPLTTEYSQMLNQRKPKNIIGQTRLPFQVFDGETFNTMIYAIQMMLDTEGHAERVRLRCFEKPGFNLPNLYQTLLYQSVKTEQDRQMFSFNDFTGTAVSIRNLKDVMENFGHHSKLDQIDYQLVVDRFDMDGDGLICYGEVSRPYSL